MPGIRSLFDRLFQSSTARGSGWIFFGMVLRVVAQFVYFVVLARSLGSSGYGVFVGVTAFVGILAPFSSLGGGNLLVKNVARDPRLFGVYYGNAIVVTLALGSGLGLLVMTFSRFVLSLNVPLLLILAVSASDLLFAQIANIAGFAFLSVERQRDAAMVYVFHSAFRLAAALSLVMFVEEPTPLAWGGFYLGSTILSSLFVSLLVIRSMGSPSIDLPRVFMDWREGFHFSLTVSAQSVYNDIDKTMLGRLGSFHAAGIYAAAYRIVDASFLPVTSVLYSSYSRFFRMGARGIRGSLGVARRLIPYMGAYTLAVGAALFLFAHYVPLLLGEKYTGTVEALRWLSILPFIKSLHYFGADTLTGADYQEQRSYVQIAVAFVNVALNLWMIPAYGWKGAAWSSILSDSLLAVGVWALVFRKHMAAGMQGKNELPGGEHGG